jgi:hypothetical protein
MVRLNCSYAQVRARAANWRYLQARFGGWRRTVDPEYWDDSGRLGRKADEIDACYAERQHPAFARLSAFR